MTQGNKTLIIVRHAHRNTDIGREKDNGLSQKGRNQAKKVAKLFAARFEKANPVLLSSPKKRCIETLEPLSKKTRSSIRILPHLNEAETFRELANRISAFRKEWSQSNDSLWVICSHGDWIPAYLDAELGLQIDLQKGGWVELVWENGKGPKLVELVQTLPEKAE